MQSNANDNSDDKNTAKENTHKMNMGDRGVTRPMHHGGHEGHSMTEDDRMQMLHMHHMQTLWIYWTIILLGAWLMLSPLTFAYDVGTVRPSGGRTIWLTLEQQVQYSKWSDIISGAILVIFGWRALLPNRPYSLWICCFVGIWITIAPLLFWAPTAAIYLNDTLVGMLVISLSILIPGMPNMMMYMKMGSEVPQGWSYNPSSWPQRWIMIVTGFLGFAVSRYLAAFQLGYITHIWDPFFGDSSMKVLNSSMSHGLPISDAGLGALAYTFEFLMGYMGSPSRWRTMPWMVAFFGILVIPLGLVHIFLVISQPIIVGAWCFFCVIAAAIMLPMIPLEVDEVIAMGQHMVQATRKGEKFWKVFWKGGKPMEHNTDEHSPEMMQLNEQPLKVIKASVWGMSFGWRLGLSTALGLITVALPAVLNEPIQSPLSTVSHLCGSLIVVVAVISMGEVVRPLRYVNILLAAGLAIVPWFYGGNTALCILNSVAGALVALLSLQRGTITEQYGLWNKYIK